MFRGPKAAKKNSTLGRAHRISMAMSKGGKGLLTRAKWEKREEVMVTREVVLRR